MQALAGLVVGFVDGRGGAGRVLVQEVGRGRPSRAKPEGIKGIPRNQGRARCTHFLSERYAVLWVTEYLSIVE